VQYREDDDDLVQHSEIDSERKRVQQRSTNVAGHRGELEWSFADVRERTIDIAEESFGETCSLVLVPPRGILEIGLGEWPNDEPAGHSVQWLPSNFFRRRS
jgi:hypothetical protein